MKILLVDYHTDNHVGTINKEHELGNIIGVGGVNYKIVAESNNRAIKEYYVLRQ